MALYIYKALDEKGHIHEVEDFFHSKEALESALHQQKMELISFNIVTGAQGRRSLRVKDALYILQTLMLLTKSGFSLLQAFEYFLQDRQKTSVKRSILSMIEKLKKGKPLDQVLEEYLVFPPYVVHIIRLGLQSGQLVRSLEQAYELMKREQERKQTMRRAGIYPLVLMLLLIAMVIVFTQMLLPQISIYLRELGVNELPFMTRALIHTAAFLEKYGLSLAVVMGCALLIALLSPRVTFLQNFLTGNLLKIPGIGRLLKTSVQNHWLFYVGRLYDSGIDFKSALDFTANTDKNNYIKNIMQTCHEKIFSGHPLVEMLRQTGMFSAFSLSLIKAGSESGKIIEACQQAYTHEDTQHQQNIELFLKSFEPSLLIIMGLFLLWIVLAVIAPIYDHLIV